MRKVIIIVISFLVFDYYFLPVEATSIFAITQENADDVKMEVKVVVGYEACRFSINGINKMIAQTIGHAVCDEITETKISDDFDEKKFRKVLNRLISDSLKKDKRLTSRNIKFYIHEIVVPRKWKTIQNDYRAEIIHDAFGLITIESKRHPTGCLF